jgi:ABC-type nitrate/sulfonate/bicarbonate transport system substrate-binding protein
MRPRFLAVAAALLCLCSIDRTVAQPVKLRYGQAFSALTSIYSLPVLIGYRQGFFARENLDFGQILIPGGGDEMNKALDNDSVDLTHVATPFLIQSVLAGTDAVAIAAEFDNPIYSLVAKPDIRSFADLKGKLIGLADEGGTITISMRELLNRHGLGDRDYRVRIISGTPERYYCLEQGACDAVPLGQPHDLEAARHGYHLIGFSTEAVPDYLYTVTAVRRSWAKAHKDVVVAYVRALAASFAFIRDPTNRPAVVKAIVDVTKFSEESAAATMKLYLDPDRHVLPQRGEIDGKGMDAAIAMMADAGLVHAPLPPAERFIDRQYLRAAGIE